MTTSTEFRRVTRDRPCPVCSKPDWCGRSDDGAVRCMRVSDPPPGWRLVKRSDDGGIVVRPADEKEPPCKTAKSSPPPADRNWSADAQRFAEALDDDRLDQFAKDLGVSPATLREIGAGYADEKALRTLRVGWSGDDDPRPTCALTIPEQDAQGRIIGLSLRAPDGRKGTPVGSKRGLVVPSGLASMPDPILLVEGATDVAVGLTLGLPCVGRPSNAGGGAFLAGLLKGCNVIVVGENDQKGDTWPGRDGARWLPTVEQLQGAPCPTV